MSVALLMTPFLTNIKTRSGPLKAPFCRVEGTNVITLTAKHLDFKAGMIFVPNQELARWSPKGTTHMAFEGLYEAFRSGEHTIRRGGATPRSKHGEMREIREDIQTARAYVHCLIASGLLSFEEETAAYGALTELVGRYLMVRNDHKKEARDQLHRSKEFKDKRGRKNPPAAGFVAGSGIGHLLHRNREIAGITINIDRRTIYIVQAIEAHMDLYKGLRVALKPRGELPPGILELLMEIDSDDEHLFLRSYRELGNFRYDFRRIVAMPFRKNAFHTAKDLATAMEYAKKHDRNGLRETYRKIVRGITWIFAQYALEMEVISPLSFLLEHLSGEVRKERRKLAVKKAAPIRRIMDASRFGRIERSLVQFIEKLEKCSDEGLETPVMERIRVHVTDALARMRNDQWFKAKDALKEASALM